MASKLEKITTVLNEAFPGDEVNVTDYAGDDDHFSVRIRSNTFQGMLPVARQRHMNSILKQVENVHAYQFDLDTAE